MKAFFEKFKTSEFWLVFLSSGGILYLMLRSTESLHLHSIGLTIMLSGYMIGRSFAKHARANAQIHGFVTSEFYFLVTGLVSLGYFWSRGRLSEGLAVLLACILLSAYAISRGNAKRVAVRPVPFM